MLALSLSLSQCKVHTSLGLEHYRMLVNIRGQSHVFVQGIYLHRVGCVCDGEILSDGAGLSVTTALTLVQTILVELRNTLVHDSTKLWIGCDEREHADRGPKSG